MKRLEPGVFTTPGSYLCRFRLHIGILPPFLCGVIVIPVKAPRKKRTRRQKIELAVLRLEESPDLGIAGYEAMTADQLAEATALLARTLACLQPDEYQEPPRPPRCVALSHAARVDVMVERFAAGLAISRPDDPWRLDVCHQVAVAVESGKPGAEQTLTLEGSR